MARHLPLYVCQTLSLSHRLPGSPEAFPLPPQSSRRWYTPPPNSLSLSCASGHPYKHLPTVRARNLSQEPARFFHKQGVVLEDAFGQGSGLLEHTEAMQLAFHIELSVAAAQFAVPARAYRTRVSRQVDTDA
jgi:hypothetical protein